MKVSTSELCAILGCTRQYISELTLDGMPKLARGVYDLCAVVPWLRQHAREAALREAEYRHQRWLRSQNRLVRLYEGRTRRVRAKTQAFIERDAIVE